jgi:uncharacterized protein (DUF2164 family)
MRATSTITLPDRERDRAIASLKQYFSEHMDEEIGDLKAALLLEYILAELGPTIYNAAIADARSFFEERTADLTGVCYHAEFPYFAKPKR